MIAQAGHNMETARGCAGCRECVASYPYKLSTPELITEKLSVWDKYLSERV